MWVFMFICDDGIDFSNWILELLWWYGILFTFLFAIFNKEYESHIL